MSTKQIIADRAMITDAGAMFTTDGAMFTTDSF